MVHQWTVFVVFFLVVQVCPLVGMDAIDDLGLDNPVLTSQQQIDQKLMECEGLLAALAQRETLPSRLQRLQALARLYMVFAGPGDRSGRWSGVGTSGVD